MQKTTGTSIIYIFLLGTFFIAVFFGRYPVDFDKILADIPKIIHGNFEYKNLSIDFKILLLRIPRIIMALIVGASLATSGMIYQCIFRNPLVSPDILGISSGACLGAALGIMFFGNNFLVVQFLAFLFGILAVIMSYYLARISKGDTIMMLIMSGIIVSSFYSALLALLKYIADPYEQLPAIVFWIMGGLYQVGWNEVSIAAPIVFISLLIIFLLRHNLNIISLGDEEAKSLGINVTLLRCIFIVCTTLAVGATISITGIIGWVGLVIPHISRILVGVNHKVSLPSAMLLGGAFVIVMDTIARTLTTQEIPIGIITSLVGAPCFAYLLLLRGTKGWDVNN